MLLWIDFFLQQFVTALAWCLAVAIVGGAGAAGLRTWLRRCGPAMRRGRD